MQTFEISNKKEFMLKLLKTDLFDSFEMREVILHTAFKMIIDGKRNKDYYDTANSAEYSLYITWGEIRKYIYDLIQGSRSPSYMKIILAANDKKTASLSEDASAFFLNISYKDNGLICSTGVSYKSFTLDQGADKIWDKRIKDFLFQYDFI